MQNSLNITLNCKRKNDMKQLHNF